MKFPHLSPGIKKLRGVRLIVEQLFVWHACACDQRFVDLLEQKIILRRAERGGQKAILKKFKENHKTPVITTRFVSEEDSPIWFVFHFDDGVWQFSGSEKNLLDDGYKVVLLGEIIEIDNSLLEIADIPLGSEARRLNSHNPWRINVENWCAEVFRCWPKLWR